MSEAVLAHSEQRMSAGSKSFTLAARFFPEELKHGARMLYSWCRACDDAVDVEAASLSSKEAVLSRLKDQTQAAFAGDVLSDPDFVAFQRVVFRHGIPRQYAFELLEGMEMDARRMRFRSLRDLERYCYCVAGTVGLMMLHVMGREGARGSAQAADHPDFDRARRHAVDLGIAMQLTNIARDIADDAAIGRIYIPTDWLAEEGVPAAIEASELMSPRYRASLVVLVERLLQVADRHYASGRAGLRYLPWRAALPVAVALEVYRAIGKKVSRRGARAWDRRAVVSRGGKALSVLRALATLPFYKGWPRGRLK